MASPGLEPFEWIPVGGGAAVTARHPPTSHRASCHAAPRANRVRAAALGSRSAALRRVAATRWLVEAQRRRPTDRSRRLWRFHRSPREPMAVVAAVMTVVAMKAVSRAVVEMAMAMKVVVAAMVAARAAVVNACGEGRGLIGGSIAPQPSDASKTGSGRAGCAGAGCVPQGGR